MPVAQDQCELLVKAWSLARIMVNLIFCPNCDTYLPPEVNVCSTCGQVRPVAAPVPVAWTVALGQSPAGSLHRLGDHLLLPTHDSDQPPQNAALHRLRLADGQPVDSSGRLDALISGLQTFEVSAEHTSKVSLLLATYSADPTAAVGSLLAFDAAGQEIWRWQPGVQSVSAPALAGETAWVTTNTGLLVSLNLATGAEQTRISLGLTPSLAAPALAAEVAYVPTRGPRLLAMRLDGQRRWQFEIVSSSGWFDRMPLVVGERLYAVGNLAGLVVALERAGGQVAWQAALGLHVGKRLSPPVTDGARLYVGAGDGLHAFDLAAGRPKWHFPTKRRIEAAPVVSGEVVYAAGHDHCLYALEAATGRELWRYPAAARLEVAPLLVNEPPLVVIADHQGQVTALERPLNPEQHEAAGRWLEAAAGYVTQGDLPRAAALLQAHGEPFKAAQLWQVAGSRQPAAQQYAVAGRWALAAELWGQQGRCLEQAGALAQHAEALAGQPVSDEDRAVAWEAAAAAFEAVGENNEAERCRLETARLRRQPYLGVKVEHDRLVVNTWTHLRFSVANRGEGTAQNLIIRARGGQFEGQVAETRQIISLQPGQTRSDWLDLRPLAPGDSVPLRVMIEHQDSSGHAYEWKKTLYLPVAATNSPQEKTMSGIPANLINQIRQVLLDCGPFDNDRHLRAVFADARLSPWRYSLPQADSLTGRVDALIDFLHNKQRGDSGDNALVLLLRALGERTDPGDACHHRLNELAAELEAALNGRPSPKPPTSPPSARGLIYGDSSRPAREPAPIRERWALLVGINRYTDPNFAPLNFCVNDVLALQRMLEGLGYKVLALHDQAGEERLRPTKDNIEAELTGVCQAVGPDDLLWVHFAGHGQLLNGQPMLITQQTRARTIAGSGLPLSGVEAQMKAGPANRLVLTLDACHVGVEVGRSGSDPQFNRHVYDQAHGFALIAASTAQQKAQEWREQQHGVFTYYLLQGLSGQADRDGKQFVTVDDLKNYVLNELRIWNPLHGGLLQEPTARTEGLGAMILADYRPH